MDHNTVSQINDGLLILLGIGHEDDEQDIAWLVAKIANLRIFNDENGVMNKSLLELKGDAIVVSQFTLMANTKKGNRPSYIRAARPESAIPLYEKFILEFETAMGKEVGRGVFGAHMLVDLCNEGPVTLILDSRNREF